MGMLPFLKNITLGGLLVVSIGTLSYSIFKLSEDKTQKYEGSMLQSFSVFKIGEPLPNEQFLEKVHGLQASQASTTSFLGDIETQRFEYIPKSSYFDDLNKKESENKNIAFVKDNIIVATQTSESFDNDFANACEYHLSYLLHKYDIKDVSKNEMTATHLFNDGLVVSKVSVLETRESCIVNIFTYDLEI